MHICGCTLSKKLFQILPWHRFSIDPACAWGCCCGCVASWSRGNDMRVVACGGLVVSFDVCCLVSFVPRTFWEATSTLCSLCTAQVSKAVVWCDCSGFVSVVSELAAVGSRSGGACRFYRLFSCIYANARWARNCFRFFHGIGSQLIRPVLGTAGGAVALLPGAGAMKWECLLVASSFHERFMLTLASSRFGSGPVPGGSGAPGERTAWNSWLLVVWNET